jgi:Bacterial regulatory proteins, luxR family
LPTRAHDVSLQPMAHIEVDIRAWPILRLKTHGSALAPEDTQRFAADMAPLLARGEPFVTVFDNTSLNRLPSARMIRAFESWVDEHRATLERLSCGTCTIAKNPIARGFARFMLHSRRPKTGGTVVASMPEAVAWCQERLAARGVRVDDARCAALLDLEPTARAPIIDAGTLDQERRAQIEVVMSAFAEPAFLVDAQGALLYANPSARDAFPDTPAWLLHAMGMGHDELKALVRLVPLDAGAPVALVIPAAELVPRAGDTPPVALPDSLSRVGELLALGMSDKEIAGQADLPLSTVRTYVTRVFKKLGVHSRGELMRLWSAPRRE